MNGNALPANAKAHVLMEVADGQEEQALNSPADVKITWLHRGSGQPDAALELAIREFAFPEGNGRIYVGAEAAANRRIRAHLLKDRSFDVSRVVTRGYWKYGDINYTDHDYGTD